ncbi:homoprotocatechuate degradation operon regulator HpaR [Aminobacter anthyllidis]|uniref:Homoprotocatechuate degradation operon regulator HpaR n=1 Tax=Aminobacter anthyllidis TaxID=1035067 RepID=A0A9X1ABR8_9HYPH|nr:homoprotocatechuate degradation operon regulator HpaR [Aminobacter anthyllidis]MBT1156923.1 homoprotocatechuate degradation operon regulator HpaR [Aminobacter anthyllidis]
MPAHSPSAIRSSPLLQSTRRSLPMSLLRAREVVMAQFRPILAQHGVSEQQWRVIRVLGEQSPLDATELAERASILAPSLTRIIKALEERKLITRGKVDGDGRRVMLAIAPKGQVLISEVAPESSAIYDEVQRRIGHERYEQLLDLLEGLIDLEKK